jgi:glycosyltransferase involved in cell wall biosynthesis
MDASKLIALSSIEAEQYKCAGVPTEKIAIIPNGLELSEDDLPTKGVFRRKFGIGDDEKIILYLGRIHKIKGIDILVKAFKKVIEEVDNVKLVVVGPDDGYLRELKSEIKSLQIENKILIPGPLYGIDKLEAYVDADVYVLPSRYEIWGMTVLESIACQTPVIVTENCGTADYVRDKAGLVVQANFNQLSKALLEMLLDTEKHSIFAKNCRIVLQEFNILATVSKLEKIYEEILFCDYKAREASFNEAHA